MEKKKKFMIGGQIDYVRVALGLGTCIQWFQHYNSGLPFCKVFFKVKCCEFFIIESRCTIWTLNDKPTIMNFNPELET